MTPSPSSGSPEDILKQKIAEHGEVYFRELIGTQNRFEARVRELSAMRQIVDALKHIQEPHRVFEGIINAIIDETNAENCSLMLLDRETDELIVKAARSQTDGAGRYYSPKKPFKSRLKKGVGAAGWVAQHGEPVSIPDITQDTRFSDSIQSIGPIGSLLCLPLKIDGQVVGVLNMSHPCPRAFRDGDVRLMMLVADQVAIALNSVQLFEDTRKLNNVLSREVDRSTEALQQANSELESEIAERKQAEQELVRTQRLRAAGELSAGVSHNLNNILTGIWGPAQLLQSRTRDPFLLRQAELINTFAERAADLVARLHQATRVDENPELQAININKIVREAIDTTKPRWKDQAESRGISVHIDTDLHDVPAATGTESGLYDALVNLIFNATDAMPKGGSIAITTGATDGEIHVIVRDTGTGMDKKTRQRIFEPFFTTKTDVGRGLGLATVYGAISSWGGKITVDSAPGQGTTFTLCLPIWTEEIEEEKNSTEVQSGRRGRILVVDDEPAIPEILSMLLESEHDVDTADSGTQTLSLFTSNRYDVVIVDLSMPEMSGDALAASLRSIDADTALILTTGWELKDDDSRLADFDFWLQKPFGDLNQVRDLVTRGIELKDNRTQS